MRSSCAPAILFAMLADSGCIGVECGPGTRESHGQCVAFADFTCADACNKQISVCGTLDEDERSACVSSCLELSAEDRDLDCYRDATCEEIERDVCGQHTGGVRGPYPAFAHAGGPFCGRDDRAMRTECLPGDNCTSERVHQCAAGVDVAYQAYAGAGGPRCGTDNGGLDVACRPDDSCTLSSIHSCAH